jgi:hypothetical protein
LNLLLDQIGETLPISEIGRMVAGHPDCGYQALQNLLDCRGEKLPITNDVLRAAAGNTGPYAPEIIQALCNQVGGLPITEEVIKVATGNTGNYTPEVIELLYEKKWRASSSD